MPPANVFSGPYLDRVAHLRKDEGFLLAAARDVGALIVPVWRSRNLVCRHGDGWSARFIGAADHCRPSLVDGDLVLLGQYRGQVCFAVELPGEASGELTADASFEDLRIAGGLLPAEEAGVLAYARAMILWRRRNRFCGSCGAPTTSANAGHVMRCTRAGCAADHFPRLDPAIIVLVTDGTRALLGRQSTWPAGRYSTIAGFVEPGESLEDAVVREVAEETGVVATDPAYHSSQPWPFPSSLMLGFTACAAPDQQPRADEELEDVRWFSREDIAQGLVALPPAQSISFRLIEDWYDAGMPVRLRDCPGLALWGGR